MGGVIIRGPLGTKNEVHISPEEIQLILDTLINKIRRDLGLERLSK